MSIKIIKNGIADSIQDLGRYGFQHLGIQPNGCMDFISACLGNYILQNELDEPVFELHFPTSQFQFEMDCTICITGANFVPLINDHSIEMHQAIEVKKNDILKMLQPLEGKTAYLSIKGTLIEPSWLGSHAYAGKRIEKDAHFNFNYTGSNTTPPIAMKDGIVEKALKMVFDSHAPIRILPGPAWKDLNEDSLQALLNKPFTILSQANRMGFQLAGPNLTLHIPNAYLSSAVTRGTLQLLPNGDIIVLMADHQTIGGYANLGQIILVDLPRFAQTKTGQAIRFTLTNLETAHQLYRDLYEKFQH